MVCASSTVPCCTPSTTPKGGINSPPACTEISNLPPVMALTALENTSAPPKTVSSDLGKLEARRQRMAACAWTAGAAPAASTPAMPACLMMEPPCMRFFLRCLGQPLRPHPALHAQDPAQGRSIYSDSVPSPIRCRRQRDDIGAQSKAHRAAHTERIGKRCNAAMRFDGQRRQTDDR